MKLDRIKFASLVAYIVGLRIQCDLDLYHLDSLTDINVEPVSTGFVEAEKVDELLRCICSMYFLMCSTMSMLKYGNGVNFVKKCTEWCYECASPLRSMQDRRKNRYNRMLV